MTPLQVANAWAGHLAVAFTLVGLLLRGRAHFCRCFACYLAVTFACESAVTLWPETFWNWSFWLFTQTVYDALKIATALELGYWVFLGFPGAAHTARGVVFLFLVGTLVAVLALPSEAGDDGFLLGGLRARLELGTAWTFTALAALVWWYRLPLPSMHRAIILGYVSYLFVFSTVMKLATDGITHQLATLEPMAYTAVCSLWAWEAWRREPALEVDPAVIARLQPWKAAC